MEVRSLGNICKPNWGTGFPGNVWDKEMLSPTLSTMQGGYREPMIIDAQAVRMVRTEEGKALRKDYENGTIHHGFNEHREMELRTDGVSNTLSTVQKDNYICEKSIVAMRGRNPENPSDRTVGSPTEQRLEPNSQGICNTLTSVQKDNLVMETVKIKKATSQGYIECEVGGVADLSFPESKTRRGRVQDKGQVSPTLMAGEQDICRIESVCAIDEQNMNVRNETFGTLTTDGSSPKHNNRVMECSILQIPRGYNNGGAHELCPPITSHSFQENNFLNYRYRIRKLTPMECWRLMDFTDEDFHKAEQVNSNTQLYKQAGNSICKNVLVAIFGQMLDGKEDVYKEINSTHFPNQQR